MQNWLLWAELAKWHRNSKILQIWFCNLALSSALMAETAKEAKQFGV